MSSTLPHLDRPLRRDAERNRVRILASARELFAERGLEVTLDDVAAHAGFGVGTVYRRFASKSELVEALFEEMLAQSADLAEAALTRADPAAALEELFVSLASQQAADRGLRDVMRGGTYGHEGLERSRRRLDRATSEVLARARAAGAAHPDLVSTDFPVLMVMIGAVSDLGREVDPDLWRRYVPLMLDAIRSPQAAPRTLDHPPLDDDRVEQAMTTQRRRR